MPPTPSCVPISRLWLVLFMGALAESTYFNTRSIPAGHIPAGQSAQNPAKSLQIAVYSNDRTADVEVYRLHSVCKTVLSSPPSRARTASTSDRRFRMHER